MLSWRTLVAGHLGVIKIVAACPLKEIATRCGLVAQLTARASEQRPGKDGIVLAYGSVGREITVADHGTDAQSAFPRRFDAAKVETADVDQPVGRHHFELHEVEQVGAAGDVGRAISPEARSFAWRGGAGEVEWRHVRFPFATSIMASTMFG